VDKITEVWVDSGSGPGHMQSVHMSGAEARVQEAYRAFICHPQECTSCRTEGVDCLTAVTLRVAWREAHANARDGS
jgi:hypothetical protein